MSIFDYHHDNPPAPFNPSSDPRAKGWYNETSNSMEDDNFMTHIHVKNVKLNGKEDTKK